MLSVASMMSLNETENFDFDVDHHLTNLTNNSFRRSGTWKKRSSSRPNSRPASFISDSSILNSLVF